MEDRHQDAAVDVKTDNYPKTPCLGSMVDIASNVCATPAGHHTDMWPGVLMKKNHLPFKLFFSFFENDIANFD
ncbi:hypothetical protein TNCT_428521 [Trichonephila clavata]|uniref:Uncharacterized protein n=1 Tax=Trichonephila clavata TaxID=2740835 RepID=A0A8X6M1W0_TRICU|nr:hypothetical protein TNCT_428521 [Trichonephila clavata]